MVCFCSFGDILLQLQYASWIKDDLVDACYDCKATFSLSRRYCALCFIQIKTRHLIQQFMLCLLKLSSCPLFECVVYNRTCISGALCHDVEDVPRRHHCRACGHVLCADCTPWLADVPGSLEFPKPSRVCEICARKAAAVKRVDAADACNLS